MFLRTIGMFLAYSPVVFTVYLKDIDNLDVLRSVAIISLYYGVAKTRVRVTQRVRVRVGVRVRMTVKKAYCH